MHKERIIMIVLIALVLGAWIYIGIDQYQKSKTLVYQQGGQAGYQQAVFEIMKQAATCQPMTLTLQNQTTELISIECLKKAQQQEPQTSPIMASEEPGPPSKPE